jgi:hypothetical protein
MNTAGTLAYLTFISAVIAVASFPVAWIWKLRHWSDVIKLVDDEFTPLKEAADTWKRCVEQMPSMITRLEAVCAESQNTNTKVDVMWGIFVKDSLSEMWRTKLGQSHSESRLTEQGLQLLNDQKLNIAGKLRELFSIPTVDPKKLSDPELTLIISRLLQEDISELAKTNDLPLRAVLGATLTYVRQLPNMKGEPDQ